MKRELRIVESATGRVVMRQDVTGFDRPAVADAAAKLQARINAEEYYVEDSADRGTGD